MLDALLERYRTQDRPLRACEPRDLIERARDICRFRGRSLELTPEVLDLAWTGYFGSGGPVTRENAEAAGIPIDGSPLPRGARLRPRAARGIFAMVWPNTVTPSRDT